jgi:hypothetical protein
MLLKQQRFPLARRVRRPMFNAFFNGFYLVGFADYVSSYAQSHPWLGKACAFFRTEEVPILL